MCGILPQKFSHQFDLTRVNVGVSGRDDDFASVRHHVQGGSDGIGIWVIFDFERCPTEQESPTPWQQVSRSRRSCSSGLSGRSEASSFNRVMAFRASSNASMWCSAVAVDLPALEGVRYQRGTENTKSCLGFQDLADRRHPVVPAKLCHLRPPAKDL